MRLSLTNSHSFSSSNNQYFVFFQDYESIYDSGLLKITEYDRRDFIIREHEIIVSSDNSERLKIMELLREMKSAFINNKNILSGLKTFVQQQQNNESVFLFSVTYKLTSFFHHYFFIPNLNMQIKLFNMGKHSFSLLLNNGEKYDIYDLWEGKRLNVISPDYDFDQHWTFFPRVEEKEFYQVQIHLNSPLVKTSLHLFEDEEKPDLLEFIDFDEEPVEIDVEFIRGDQKPPVIEIEIIRPDTPETDLRSLIGGFHSTGGVINPIIYLNYQLRGFWKIEVTSDKLPLPDFVIEENLHLQLKFLVNKLKRFSQSRNAQCDKFINAFVLALLILYYPRANNLLINSQSLSIICKQLRGILQTIKFKNLDTLKNFSFSFFTEQKFLLRGPASKPEYSNGF